nr:phospholipase D-like domain-containing protein [Pseudomonas chlororaphis]
MKFPRTLLSVRIAGLAGLLISPLVQADFVIPGFELVHTVPVDTALGTADLRQPGPVWIELFDGAKSQIDIGQFYAADHPGSVLGKVIEHLEAAGKQAFVGSQNFDWRSLEHIHETGLRISDEATVAQVQAIFEQDWQAQAALAANQPVPLPAAGQQPARSGNYLVASPQRYNPPGVGDSQLELPRLLAEAKNEVRVQLLDYAPLSYGPDRTRPYYAVIDNAVRAAAARGVSIKLLVSNWNTDQLELPYLKSLAVLPNVQVRIVTLPQASQGFIPYARVIHSKTMDIDGQVAWVGTSNWLGGYLDNSRNLEVVMHDSAMAKRIGELHEQLWGGPYAKPLELMAEYPDPHPGTP